MGMQSSQRTVLELTVNNHPGVMAHVVGLFSRRAFNVEGILCLPLGTGETSRIWLQVNEDERLPQMIRQVEKLHDVRSVVQRQDNDALFAKLEKFLILPDNTNR